MLSFYSTAPRREIKPYRSVLGGAKKPSSRIAGEPPDHVLVDPVSDHGSKKDAIKETNVYCCWPTGFDLWFEFSHMYNTTCTPGLFVVIQS